MNSVSTVKAMSALRTMVPTAPTEAVAIGREIEVVEAGRAKERQLAGVADKQPSHDSQEGSSRYERETKWKAKAESQRCDSSRRGVPGAHRAHSGRRGRTWGLLGDRT